MKRRLALVLVACATAAGSAQTLPGRTEPVVPESSRTVRLPAGFVMSDAPRLVFLIHGQRVNVHGHDLSLERDVVASEVLPRSSPRIPAGYDAAMNYWLRPAAARRIGLPAVVFRLNGKRTTAARVQSLPADCVEIARAQPARTERRWWGGHRERPAEVWLRVGPECPSS